MMMEMMTPPPTPPTPPTVAPMMMDTGELADSPLAVGVVAIIEETVPQEDGGKQKNRNISNTRVVQSNLECMVHGLDTKNIVGLVGINLKYLVKLTLILM